MTLTLPDSPAASFDRLLEVASTLKSLSENKAALSAPIGSDYGISGWTAINAQPIEPRSSSIDNDNACSTADVKSETSAEEVYSGGERDILFSFEADQAVAYDTETGVYMNDVQAGSWAGRMCDDEAKDVEIQNMVTLNHVRRVQESSNAQQRAAEGPSYDMKPTPAHNVDSARRSYLKDDERKKPLQPLEKDKAARVVISAIKSALTEGGTLILNYAGAQEAYIHSCCGCAASMPANTYYVCVGIQMLEDYRYCLTCFEGMWTGNMLIGSLPDPRAFKKGSDGKLAEADQCTCHGDVENSSDVGESRRTTQMNVIGGERLEEGQQHSTSKLHNTAQQSTMKQPIIKLSGALLDSKHAPKPGEIAVPQLVNTIGFAKQLHQKEPQPIFSALRSTLPPQSSNAVKPTHCSRFAPTRFQHLAHHIEAGDTLNEVEKAAVHVWKATTKDQFRCMSRFMAVSMKTTLQNGIREQSSEVEEALKVVGRRELEFYGRDLSDILAMVAARDDV